VISEAETLTPFRSIYGQSESGSLSLSRDSVREAEAKGGGDGVKAGITEGVVVSGVFSRVSPS